MPDEADTTGGAAATRTEPQLRRLYAKLPAQDVERARRFYAHALGLRPVAERDRHLQYELAGSRFVVFPSRGRASGTHEQLGFVVDDIARTVADLRARGVVFEQYATPPTDERGIADVGDVKAAWFKDSEGNLVSVAEFAGGSPLDA